MRNAIFSGLIIVLSLVVIVSFFTPWAKASVSLSKAAKGITSMAEKEFEGTPYAGKVLNFLQKASKAIDTVGNVEVRTTVSGYDIPTLVHKKSSQSAIAMAQIFFANTEGLEKKVMLLYLLPLFGVICVFFALLGLRSRLWIAGTAIIGGIISIGGFYSLSRTNFSGEQYQIILLNGVWYTLYAYLFICIFSIVWLAIGQNRKDI